jgi:hypothetical protein
MTEKHAVLIKYKYLEYIDSAKLSDADAWTFLKSIIEYDKTGMEPTYSNPVLLGLFAVVKIDLDKNKENYEAVLEERRKAGKEGAKKRWGEAKDGKNSKCQENIAKIANDGNCYVCQENIAKIADLDLDSDLDPEFVYKKTPLPPDSDRDQIGASAPDANAAASDFSVSETGPPKQAAPHQISSVMTGANAAGVWERIRKEWNSHNCRFTCDKLYLNLSVKQRERVAGTLATYSADQIIAAIRKYFEERKTKPRDFEYKSFYLFVETGVEFYVET